jgi:hypothetical protein
VRAEAPLFHKPTGGFPTHLPVSVDNLSVLVLEVQLYAPAFHYFHGHEPASQGFSVDIQMFSINIILSLLELAENKLTSGLKLQLIQ